MSAQVEESGDDFGGHYESAYGFGKRSRQEEWADFAKRTPSQKPRSDPGAMLSAYADSDSPFTTQAEVRAARLTVADDRDLDQAEDVAELLLILGLDPEHVDSSRFIESCS